MEPGGSHRTSNITGTSRSAHKNTGRSPKRDALSLIKVCTQPQKKQTRDTNITHGAVWPVWLDSQDRANYLLGIAFVDLHVSQAGNAAENASP